MKEITIERRNSKHGEEIEIKELKRQLNEVAGRPMESFQPWETIA